MYIQYEDDNFIQTYAYQLYTKYVHPKWYKFIFFFTN